MLELGRGWNIWAKINCNVSYAGSDTMPISALQSVADSNAFNEHFQNVRRFGAIWIYTLFQRVNGKISLLIPANRLCSLLPHILYTSGWNTSKSQERPVWEEKEGPKKMN